LLFCLDEFISLVEKQKSKEQSRHTKQKDMPNKDYPKLSNIIHIIKQPLIALAKNQSCQL
jgi:hypothetical protein